jgi:hypothetical protein
MLQMGSLQPDVTRPAQTHDSNALSEMVPSMLAREDLTRANSLRLFLLSPVPQGVILLQWAKCDGASRMATGVRTERSRWAYLAVCGRGLDLDHLVCPEVLGRSPAEAFVPLPCLALGALTITQLVVLGPAKEQAKLALEAGPDPRATRKSAVKNVVLPLDMVDNSTSLCERMSSGFSLHSA